MPDITMCVNTECPLRGGCYRYLAIPSFYRQSFATFTPDRQVCVSFWPLGQRANIKSVEDVDAYNKPFLRGESAVAYLRTKGHIIAHRGHGWYLFGTASQPTRIEALVEMAEFEGWSEEKEAPGA